MKKRAITLLVLIIFLLSSCNGKSASTAYELFSKIQNSISLPKCEIYSYIPPEASDNPQKELLSRLYSQEGSNSDIPPAIFLCDDYIICLYSGNAIWELHIFRTVSKYDNSKLFDMLMSRRDKLQNVEIDGYADEKNLEIIRSASVFEYKNFVILAVTGENDKIKKSIGAD